MSVPQQRAALVEGQRIADAIPALARTRRPPPAGPIRADVERALASAAGLATGAQVDVEGDRVRLTLPAAPFDGIVALLESLQRDAQLQLVEATLTARVETGRVRAELLLGR
jgi:type II secretory pathway component PulM